MHWNYWHTTTSYADYALDNIDEPIQVEKGLAPTVRKLASDMFLDDNEDGEMKGEEEREED